MRVLLILILMAAVCSASDLGYLYPISLGAAGGATAADIATSYGKLEANPLVRGRGGYFDARSAAIKGVAVAWYSAGQVIVVRRQPRWRVPLMVANFGLAAVFGAVAYRNQGQAGGRR